MTKAEIAPPGAKISGQLIQGNCHCGNVRFKLYWSGDAKSIAARQCGCTFCQKHGGTWTSDRDARLEASYSDKAAVSLYRFGTNTATFHICSRCGVATFVTSEIQGHIYAVVNVNAFEEGASRTCSIMKTDFAEESLDARLRRRANNWIGDVWIES